MTTEADYYENVDFWKPGAMLEDDQARMEHIGKSIPSVASLLDVGCGNGTFLEYIRSSRSDIRTLHGAERSAAALSFVQVPKTQASIESLPFDDKSFDCVTCLEVIEHLPLAIYLQALSELSRVARQYVILSVPNSQDLTLGQVRCTCCATLFNPDYHLRSYSADSLQGIFDPSKFSTLDIASFGNGIEYAFSRFLTRIKNDHRNRFPQDLPCPVCGQILPGRRGAQMTPITDVKGSSSPLRIVKALWPKRREHRWLLGRYRRIEP